MCEDAKNLDNQTMSTSTLAKIHPHEKERRLLGETSIRETGCSRYVAIRL